MRLSLTLGGKNAVEKHPSEAAMRRLPDRWTALLDPLEVKLALAVHDGKVPGDEDAPLAHGQSSIPSRIGRQFVKRHAQRDGEVGGKIHLRSFQPESLPSSLAERSELAQQHLAQG